MDQKAIQHEGIHFETLFNFYLIWFRLVGVTLRSHKKSILYDLYSTVVLLNAYSVIITMCLDVFLHFNDLERIMETSRVIVPASSALWINLSLR